MLQTIQSFTIPDCNFLGTACKLRRYYDGDWQDENGELHLGGNVGSPTDFFDEIPCTISASTITVPSFTTMPTLTALVNTNVRETWQLWDQAGKARNIIADSWFIPSSPTSPPAWTRGQLEIENRGQTLLWPPPTYLTNPEFLSLIQSFLQGLFHETSTGTGVQTVYALARIPVLDSEVVFVNGIKNSNAVSGDNTYQISGSTITFNLAPQTQDRIEVYYRINSGLVGGGQIPNQIQEGGGPTVLTWGTWAAGTYAFRGLGSSIIGQQLPEIDVRGYASFAAALSVIGLTPTTLLISTPLTVTSNTFLLSNVGLRFAGEGKLTISNGVTLTHTGPLIAERRQIFGNALSGQGTVSFAGNRSISEVYPEWWGGAGDAATDNAGPFAAAFEAANTGGGILVTLPGGTFHVNSTMNSYGSASLRGAGSATVIKNATGTHGELFFQPKVDGVSRTATATITAGGVLSLTLSNVTTLAIGDRVELFLGTDPTDATLPYVWMYNTISNIVGSVVTFLIGVPEDVTGTSHVVKKVLRAAENIEISNLAFTTQGPANIARYNMIYLNECRNVYVRNVKSYDQTQNTVLISVCENVTIENATASNIQRYPSDISSGSFITGWTVRNVNIRNVSADLIDNIAIEFEGQSRGIFVDTAKFTAAATYTGNPSMMTLAGNCKNTSARNITLVNPSATPLVNRGWDYTENVRLVGTNILWPLTNHHGYISWNGVNAYQRKSFSLMFPVRPGDTQVITLPAGWLADMRVYVSSKTGITQFTVEAPGGDAENISLAQLTSGQTVQIAFTKTFYETEATFNGYAGAGYAKRIDLVTDGTVPSGTYGVVYVEMFMPVVNDLVKTMTQDTVKLVRTGEVALTGYAFASLPAGVQAGTVIFVTDGTAGSPLTGAGTGCLAVRQNSSWKGL